MSKYSSPSVEAKLIVAGVRNLKDFGYPEVNEKNILTDAIYSAFFNSMLEDNRGKGCDREIDSLLKQIADNAK